MSTRSLSFAAPLTLAAALFSFNAHAQGTCESTADCPMGYECQVTGGGACAVPDCAEGEACPDVECEPMTFSDCVAVPDACTSNSDCSEGMVCFTHTSEECSGDAAPCVEGMDCPPAPPPECNTVTQSACVPRYMLPCQQAADCGEGFECKPQEICQCSGSGGSMGGGTDPGDSGGMASGDGTPPSDGSEPAPEGAGGQPGEKPEPMPEEPSVDPVPPEEPSCSCMPTDTNYCAIIKVACETDAECPANWTCSPNPEGVACSRPDGSSGTGAECGSTEPTAVCLPPFANTVIGMGSDGGPVYAGDDNASGEAGLDGGEPTSAPESPEPPGKGPGADPGNGASESEEGASDDEKTSSGCSVAGPSSSSAAWLSLLGLAALLRGRRRRAA